MNNNLKGRNTRDDVNVGDKFEILVTDIGDRNSVIQNPELSPTSLARNHINREI